MNDRNQPCKCGSGKKTKKCCDTAEKHNAAMAKQKAKMREQVAKWQKEDEENAAAGRPTRSDKAKELIAVFAAIAGPVR